ncbi:hypothetical protein [Nocardioides aurantiacus]|uniref:Uncharacterized protein n=1 Tax=Nocardioides aurantiacus TaxID=86796 RepID=A0A3N2CU51_9ACTN|nr:hypothetical protein [Nocardioides aurantiacus]ROR91059.1 hypothetical protein EDD33_1919 [Nocardioides aurantiacus]
MTYGENAGAIHDELVALLRHHRVQQRIGGRGTYSVPESTTREQREQLGRVIRRYRHAVLVWCSQALHATGDKTRPARAPSRRTPEEQLGCLLGEVVRAGPGDLRLVELLATPHEFELVTRWQSAARAAALGEHDFPAGVNRGRLSEAENRTVVRDAAQVVRALAVLDTRYALIPGWKAMAHHNQLARVASEVADTLRTSREARGVDRLGHRKRAERLLPGGERGVALALLAQHNLILELTQLPTALNLRRVMRLQALASQDAGRLAGASEPDLAAAFLERSAVYRQLLSDCRNLAGTLGAGEGAVMEGHRVLAALDAAEPATGPQAGRLDALRRLFSATDARISVLIEAGMTNRDYFVGVTVPRLGTTQVAGVRQARVRYMPADTQPRNTILPLVRERLRPPAAVGTDATSGFDRSELGQVLSLQPRPGPHR